MSKWLQAGLAAFVLQAAASMLFYGVLMADAYADWEAEVARAEPMLIYGLLGWLIFSLAMAALYRPGYEGGDPLQEGARFGLKVGVLLSGIVVMYYGLYALQLAGAVLDIVFNVILLAAMGALIGKVYGSAAAE